MLKSFIWWCVLVKLRKMYKLRSGKSYTTTKSVPVDENLVASSSPGLRQSTIQFRKRRHPSSAVSEAKLKSTTESIEDLFSPTKRSKPIGKSLHRCS